MARYRRKGFRRFRRYGRRSYKNKYIPKHRSGGGMIPRPEIKMVDAYDSGASLTFTTAMQYSAMNYPLTGAGYYNRIGNRISMKSAELKIQFFGTGATTGNLAGCMYRIMLVYDSQANGSAPGASDLLSATNTAGTQTFSYLAGINMNNRDRFLILKDWFFNTCTEGDGSASDPRTVKSSITSSMNPSIPRCLKWYVKLKGLETLFKQSTGAIADIATGSLLLCWVSSTGPTLSAFANVRLRFYD